MPARAGVAPGILHVDLDAFFASVEQVDDPSLQGRPVVVGGLGPRGVVAAASYEARRFGIRSAMPMAQARRACADAVFLAPRFEAYQAASRIVMQILGAYSPLVEPISLDEAFLDARGAARSGGTGPELAARIRDEIRAATRLTASVGVATTKLLAKLASDLAKPDGLLVVEPGTELAFLHPLSVERLWGVGPATRRRLSTLGVRTVGDLAALDVATLVAAVGESHGRHLADLAQNRDERRIEPDRTVQSVGHEETFPTDRFDRAELRAVVTHLAARVGTRLRDAGQSGRTITLKVRFATFRTITRSRSLPGPTARGAEIAAVAVDLLDGVDVGLGIRLLGVSVKGFAPIGVQGTLGLDLDSTALGPAASTSGADPARVDALEASLDEVRRRYGDGAVRRGGRPDRREHGSDRAR